MTIRMLRDAAIADVKLGMAKTFKTVDTAPRTISPQWIERTSARCPACLIGFTTIRQLKRTNAGTFVGPIELCANIVATDKAGNLAQDALLDLMTDFATYIEMRKFGVEKANGAYVTGIENIFSLDQDKGGMAIGTVTWRQQYEFGRDFLQEEVDQMNRQYGGGTLRDLVINGESADFSTVT
ncbi:hypothetical protein [Hyphomicrobium sp.]|uniref:hypothetical protein n=1 Tax=Hyphomicrobium sp. TaxID=82 RepID=UPI001DCE08CC|nr:hypothetical protein [Hyphomicrobium sp.]MBY0559866.1 hypothetical protein [Hyphomicrobium sp.]